MRIRSQCLVLVAVLGGACVEDTPRGPTAADPGWDAGLDGGVVADLGDPGTPALRDEGAPDEGDQGVQPVDAGPTWTIGDPCRGHEDCPGGWCTGVPGEEISVCSYSCFQSCPSGWSCTPVTGLGPDRIFLCVPLPAAVCSPCSASEECGTLSVCVENRGEAEGVDGEGAPGVCLLDCGSTAGSCAGGFACAPRRLVDGEESREVCTPTEGIGCCAAATEGRQASCKRTNEHGTCEGEQVCRGRAGWTRCSARTPSDETCNSVDDDCDGETDEGQGADCSCGDGVCAAEGGEDQSTCPCDCHSCGDGVCTPCGESPTRCREDCCGSCGDGVCHGPDCGEDASTCAEDCSAACGNGACERGEDPFGCPEDCRLGWCGNGTCEGIDGGAELCPEDCAPYCGDCACGGLEAATGAETWSDCPVDCGSCGDGLCSACPELLEDPVRCPEDCCVATFEACNGRDDDCDGRTDEDFDAGRPCEDPPGGECFAGVLACDPESTMPLGSSVCTDGAPWPAGSPCGRYGCAAGYILLPGSCDGAGGCVSQGFNDCGGEACAGEARCGQGCAEEGDCRDGYACVRGVCTPARSDCAEDAGCIEGDPCTVDVCDRHGVCAHLPRADCGPEADTDGDGIRNGEDGCAEHFDPEAEDADSDGTPDACDPCVATAETETLCDGVDEDCDGLTDEDFDVGRPCGEAPDPCKRFEVRCTGTAESACRPASPAPPGTVCEPASCEGAVETSAGLCDAEGRCLPGRIRSCHPFDCSGAERCATGCAEDAQCFDGFYCMGGACTPKASLGERCLRDGACERGICADGVCCAEACEESCRSCALPGFVGQCAAVTGAEDPDSCAGDRRCDAGGECRAELGARCRAGAECETGYCADGLCCVEACEDSCRSCAEPGLPGLCVDVRLAVDADTCTGRFGCDSVGRCRLVLGQACVADEDCIAGYCVNGVCCQQRCEGLCVQCDRPGSRGSCVPRTAGTDPEGCRGTAACDGAGRCRLVAGAACDADGECMSGFCADGICCDRPCAALCRSCVEPASLGICKALTDVEQPALCAGDHVCDPDGRCVRRRGQPCFDASECATGHCVDGFCCDRACDGPCEACGVGGSEGTCTVRADGSDPEGDCSACHVCDGQGACRPASARSDPKEDCEPEEGCGLDGSCDGLGGCRRRGEETICGTQRCDGRAFVGAAVCDGGGSCVEPPPETCPGALLCDGAGSACRAVCTGDEACAEGHFCAGARCLPRREDGAPCATTRECLSGACVDGACCEGPCPGACRSCALSGREGECALSPKGQNPRGACGGVRVCDGEGGCASPGGERCETAGDCLDRRCADGFCCDKPCEGACKACNVEGSEGLCVLVPEGEDPDGDCPGEDVCGPEGECVALDGAACEAGADCLSGRCSDGLCCAERCARCHGCAEPGSEGTCAPRPRGSDPGDECEGALLCDGAGGCIAPDAEPCALGLECLSGVCADGLCCAGECDGACMSCALPGSRGRCAFVGHGDDPGGECTGNAACDGAGGCASPIGEPCEEAAGCLSGACADGVCCEESCDEPCRRCNAPGGRGLCLAIPRGWDFKGDCGEGSVCDGAGGCLRLGGQACEDASDCLGGKCVDGVCCDRDCAGRCEACDTEGHEGVCTPVPTGADPDEECAGDSVCGALGGCVEQQGGPCFSGLDCLGGVCADGVCCDSACDGPCEACDLEGAVGTCGLLAVGAKPRRICPDPFVCDALGECGLPEGVVCTEDDDCATGGCTDGVCCPGGCEGLCRSCAVGGFEGPAPPPPRPSRAAARWCCPGAIPRRSARAPRSAVPRGPAFGPSGGPAPRRATA